MGGKYRSVDPARTGAFYDRPVDDGKPARDTVQRKEKGPGVLGVAGIAAMPVVLAGNSLLLLLVPWLADLQYALPGFPDDPLGLDPSQRLALAHDGIRSVWPTGPGTELLTRARLPWGEPAFDPDEIAHMDDVRAVVRGALVLWLAALIVFAASCGALYSRLGLASVQEVFRRGAAATVVAVAVVGIFALVSFDTFFRGFHDLLFEPGSWEFPSGSTLISLYPTRFWVTATALLVILTFVQAALARFLPRRPGAV